MIEPSRKAIILLALRPETVHIAVERLAPATLGVMFSQDVLLAIAEKCRQLGDSGVEFRFRMVDDPMEISDAFSKFEMMLSELESAGHNREDILLDATGGTTPMRLGVALAAISRGIAMIHQRVPQTYADGRWERTSPARSRWSRCTTPWNPPAFCARARAFTSSSAATTRRRPWSSRT